MIDRHGKVHILEGTDRAGTTFFTACNRRLIRRTSRAGVVGRAFVLRGERVDEVTCAWCRQKYELK